MGKTENIGSSGLSFLPANCLLKSPCGTKLRLQRGMEFYGKKKKKFSICPKVKVKPTARDKIHTSFKQLVRNVQRLCVQSTHNWYFKLYVEGI